LRSWSRLTAWWWGLDADAAALEAARTTLTPMNPRGIELVQADINSVETSSLQAWGPFDVAVCRLLLVHQTDPVATLRAVMRDSGFPRLDPPIPSVERIRDLDVAHIRARGLPYDIAWEYGEVFEAAGLKLLEWRGHFSLHTTDTTFLGVIRNLLPFQKSGLVAYGLATEEEIEALTAEVDAALARPMRRSTTVPFVGAIGDAPE
jgi:hypothetical protein